MTPFEMIALGRYGRKRIAADTPTPGDFAGFIKCIPTDTVTYVAAGCAATDGEAPSDLDPVPSDRVEYWPASSVQVTGGEVWAYYAKRP